jgi:drug/metabolite transporter (DMT)-like permease
VQVFYFQAIVSLPVGIAVLIEYLAPVLVALYAWLVLHQPAGRRRAGLRGVAYALLAAVAYAFYILVVEGRMSRRPPVATLCWGFGFATAFWLVVEPPW